MLVSPVSSSGKRVVRCVSLIIRSFRSLAGQEGHLEGTWERLVVVAAEPSLKPAGVEEEAGEFVESHYLL